MNFLVTNTVATEVTFIAAACIQEKCGRVNEQAHNPDITEHCQVYTSRYGVDLILRNNANNNDFKSGVFKKRKAKRETREISSIVCIIFTLKNNLFIKATNFWKTIYSDIVQHLIIRLHN